MYIATKRWAGLKPPLGVQLDYSNNLTRGLVGCWLMNEGGGFPRNIITNSSYQGGTSVWTLRPKNISYANSTVSTYVDKNLDFTSGDWTIATLIDLYSGGSYVGGEYNAFFGKSVYVSESNNQGWSLALNGVSGNNCFCFNSSNNNGSANYRLNSSIKAIQGIWLLVGTSNRTTRKIYINGLYNAQTNNNPNPAIATPGVQFCSSANSSQGIINRSYVSYAWNRALSSSEIQSLYVAPYQIVRPIRRIFYSIPPSVVAGINTGQFSRIQQISRVQQVII